nr:MAG: replication associated protein [Cressdnaviricota sp.]
MSTPVHVYDLTIACSGVTKEKLISFFRKYSKKFCFQQEKGEKTGYDHFQCRMSLKEKRRLTNVVEILNQEGVIGGHLSPTSKENQTNCFYVCKDDTRVAGPWKDDDPEPYTGWDLEGWMDIPWQQEVLASRKLKDRRTVNVILDLHGNIGKSILVKYMLANGLGEEIPPVNDYKDLMRLACDLPTASLYIIDMPRGLNQTKVSGLYAGIESIKNGVAWDDRYSFKRKLFPPPAVWVFCNRLPDEGLLSRDRWKIWTIKRQILTEYVPHGGATAPPAPPLAHSDPVSVMLSGPPPARAGVEPGDEECSSESSSYICSWKKRKIY